MEPSAELMRRVTEETMRARKTYLESDFDEDAWEVTTDMLKEVFDKPEHLLTQVIIWFHTMRKTSERQANTFSDVGSYHERNIRVVDQKIARVDSCVEYVAGIREKQKAPSDPGKN